MHPVDVPDLSDVGIRLQIQSVSESVPIRYKFIKTLKEILLTLQKDKLPDSTSTSLNDVYTRWHLQMSESWMSWWPVLCPLQKPKQAY